jgi:hypothetical protein
MLASLVADGALAWDARAVDICSDFLVYLPRMPSK